MRTVIRISFAAIVLCCSGLVACSNPDVAKREHLEKGKALAAAHNYTEAILEYKNAIKLDAKYGEARAALAEAYLQSGQTLEAARQYVVAAELLPSDVKAQSTAAVVLLSAGEYSRAKERANAALKLDPKNVDSAIVLALASAGLQDLNGAMKEMQEAVDVAPADFRPYMTMGSLQAQAGKTDEAEASFKKAIAMSPDAVAPHMAYGYYCWSTGQDAEAEKELKLASALPSQDPTPHRLLAMFYIAHKRPADAETPLLRLANQKDGTGTLTLGDLYLSQGHPEKARPVYVSLSSQPGMKTVALSRLASLDYAAGKTAEAHAALDGLLKEQPNNIDLLGLQTRWYVKEHRLDEALTVASTAVKSAPNSAPAQYALGMVYAARQENEQATNAFKETLRLNPRIAEAQIQLSRLSLASGKAEEALSYAEAASQQSRTAVARASVAYALIAKRDYPRADAEVRAMEKDYPDAAATHTLRGLLLTAHSDTAAAAKELDRALALDPHDLQALTARLSIDLGMKQPAQGRARLARAVAENPGNSSVLVIAARFENTAGDPAAAEKYLRRSIDVDPSNLEAYLMLGRMYVAQKRIDDARAEFQRVAARRPSEPGPKTMVGVLYDAQRRYDESTKVYEDVVRTSPRAGVASNNLAYLYAMRGVNLDAALQLAQTAKQQMPSTPEVDDTLGFVYYKKNRPELAIPPLLSCVEKAPENATCHLHLGLAYAKAGNNEKAVSSLQKALKLQPSVDGAEEARAQLAKLGR